ncbi:putative metalloprotease CJM1_0395 family protein [Kaarinaea lacus]
MESIHHVAAPTHAVYANPSQTKDRSVNIAGSPQHTAQHDESTSSASPETRSASGETLSKEEKQQAEELAARDREVRAHEAAHQAAGGNLAGAASFSYTTGPDGKRYATGGEVSIDTSEVAGDPQATVIKANRIRAAALAPAEPSAQDQRVAAQAAQMATEARAQMLREQQSSDEEKPDQTNSTQQNSAAPNSHHGPIQQYALTASLTQSNANGQQLNILA